MSGYRCGVAVFKVGGYRKTANSPFVVPFPHSVLRCTKHIHTRLRVRPTFLHTRGWTALCPDVTILSTSFWNCSAADHSFNSLLDWQPFSGFKVQRVQSPNREAVGPWNVGFPKPRDTAVSLITIRGTQGAAARSRHGQMTGMTYGTVHCCWHTVCCGARLVAQCTTAGTLSAAGCSNSQPVLVERILTFSWCHCTLGAGGDSSVAIATRYGPDGAGIESQWGRDFPHSSRLALRPT